MEKNERKNNDFESEKYKLLASHIEMFKDAFGDYIKQYESAGDELNGIIFEELLCNYYQTVISALKKLAEYDKKYIPVLIKTYEELWRSAPKSDNRNYICPYLSDLCKFLYKIKESGALAFFYNLLIYCREIPFLSLNVEQEKGLADAYESNKEEDPFVEFRKERLERIAVNFNEGLFKETYDRFFLILSGWNDKIKGYYTKDEICFINGLFIADELADSVYFDEESAGRPSDGKKLKTRGDGINEIFRKTAQSGEINAGADENVYRYVYGDEMKEKISRFYEKALRYFKRAIDYNPNNPRYYYEYARCLKNSGKSGEAEIFFKKAFDLNG